MKRWKKMACAMIFCLALIAILVVLACRNISMCFVDFPVTKLAKFDASTPVTVASNGASIEVSPAVDVRRVIGNGSSAVRSPMNRVYRQPGTMFVDVLVNGEPCTLILDTGCPVTTLSPTAARRARVPVSDKAFGTLYKIEIEQGDTPARWGWATNLSIGGYTIQNLPLWVWERQHEVRMLGMPVYHMDGLLGLDVLREFVLTIDMSEPSARFDRNAAPLDASFMKVPFKIEQNRILVAASVNGQPIGECEVDTGASGEVLLSSPVWKGLKFKNSPTHADMELGGLALTDVPLAESSRLNNRARGLIPAHLFAEDGKGTVTLDFPNSVIVCPRHKSSNAATGPALPRR